MRENSPVHGAATAAYGLWDYLVESLVVARQRGDCHGGKREAALFSSRIRLAAVPTAVTGGRLHVVHTLWDWRLVRQQPIAS